MRIGRAIGGKPGLSDKQGPILVAVDRSGATTCSALPSVTVDSVQCAFEPMIDDDILLTTDGINVYPKFSSWSLIPANVGRYFS